MLMTALDWPDDPLYPGRSGVTDAYFAYFKRFSCFLTGHHYCELLSVTSMASKGNYQPRPYTLSTGLHRVKHVHANPKNSHKL